MFMQVCEYESAISAGKMLEHLNRMGLKRTLTRTENGGYRIICANITAEEMYRVGRFNLYLLTKERVA